MATPSLPESDICSTWFVAFHDLDPIKGPPRITTVRAYGTCWTSLYLKKFLRWKPSQVNHIWKPLLWPESKHACWYFSNVSMSSFTEEKWELEHTGFYWEALHSLAETHRAQAWSKYASAIWKSRNVVIVSAVQPQWDSWVCSKV